MGMAHRLSCKVGSSHIKLNKYFPACKESGRILNARFFIADLFVLYLLRGPPFDLHFKKIRNGGHRDARMDTNPD